MARNAEFLATGRHGAPTPAQAGRDPLAGEPVTLAGYVFGDHSLTQVAGSTLVGGQRALAAFGVSAVALLGVAYLLLLPRLRRLALVPLLIPLPTLFIAGRTAADPFAAAAVWWPVLPASAAVLAYAAVALVRAS
jgi:hypothetical protein